MASAKDKVYVETKSTDSNNFYQSKTNKYKTKVVMNYPKNEQCYQNFRIGQKVESPNERPRTSDQNDSPVASENKNFEFDSMRTLTGKGKSKTKDNPPDHHQDYFINVHGVSNESSKINEKTVKELTKNSKAMHIKSSSIDSQAESLIKQCEVDNQTEQDIHNTLHTISNFKQETLSKEKIDDYMEEEEPYFNAKEFNKIWSCYIKVNRTLILFITKELTKNAYEDIKAILYKDDYESIGQLKKKIYKMFLWWIENMKTFDKKTDIIVDEFGNISYSGDKDSVIGTRETVVLRDRMVPINIFKPYYKFFVPSKFKEIRARIKNNYVSRGSTFGEKYFDNKILDSIESVGIKDGERSVENGDSLRWNMDWGIYNKILNNLL